MNECACAYVPVQMYALPAGTLDVLPLTGYHMTAVVCKVG